MAYRETPKTQARKADNKAKILVAARKLVARGGFAGLTMSAVAEGAGLATGSMYRYFPNKVELCTALFRELSGLEVAKMQEIVDSKRPPGQAIASCCQTFVMRAFRAPVQSYALMAEPLDPALELERLLYRQAYAKVYEQAIAAGIGSGDFTIRNAHIGGTATVGLMAEPLLEPLYKAYSGQTIDDDVQALALQISQLCLNALGHSGQLNTPLHLGGEQHTGEY